MVPQELAIQRAMSFSLDHVSVRYAADQDVPLEVAREHERECRRYLLLAAIKPGNHYAMRGPIDEFWHTFIIFTREYADFCQEVAGRFLHHVPRTPDQNGDPTKGGYARFHDDYTTLFKEAPPAHIWPVPVGAKDSDADLCSFNLCRCDSCVVVPDPPDSCDGPIPNGDDDGASAGDDGCGIGDAGDGSGIGDSI